LNKFEQVRKQHSCGVATATLDGCSTFCKIFLFKVSNESPLFRTGNQGKINIVKLAMVEWVLCERIPMTLKRGDQVFCMIFPKCSKRTFHTTNPRQLV